MGFPKSKRGYQSARLMPLVFFMTYKIIDQQSETKIEFTAYGEDIVDITCFCSVTGQQLAFMIKIQDLFKVSELLKKDLSENE